MSEAAETQGARVPKDAPVGGQAVLEGVMMRGVSTWAVAVRKPSAEQLADGAEWRPEDAAAGEIASPNGAVAGKIGDLGGRRIVKKTTKLGRASCRESV